MVKKIAVILGILAMLALGAGMSWGYTVSQWPVPGIPHGTFGKGSPCLPGPYEFQLRGPVAPSCRPPLIPGLIHAALSIPFRVVGVAVTPLFAPGRRHECCRVRLDGPAFVTAAVPCTPVNRYVPPRRW